MGTPPVLRQRGDGDAAGGAARQGRRPPRRLRQPRPQPEVRRTAGLLRLLRVHRRRRCRAGALRRRARVAAGAGHDGVARARESVAELHLRAARRRLRQAAGVPDDLQPAVLRGPDRGLRVRQVAGPLRLRDGRRDPRAAGRTLQARGDGGARRRRPVGAVAGPVALRRGNPDLPRALQQRARGHLGLHSAAGGRSEAHRRGAAAHHRAGIRGLCGGRGKDRRRRARAARLQPDHPQAQRPAVSVRPASG